MILEFVFFFFFNDTATTEIYTLSLHDALPISPLVPWRPSYAYIGMCVNDWPAASRGTASRAGLCDQRPAATVRQVEDRRKVCRPCCASSRTERHTDTTDQTGRVARLTQIRAGWVSSPVSRPTFGRPFGVNGGCRSARLPGCW